MGYNTMDEMYQAMLGSDYSGFEEEIVGALAQAQVQSPYFNPYQGVPRPPNPLLARQGYPAQAAPQAYPLPWMGPARPPVAMRSAQPATGIVPGPLPRLMRVPLGIDSGTPIPAGATADIPLKPQVKFRPERLIVDDTVAGFFLVKEVKVGKNSLLPSADAVPASVFKTAATDVQLAFRTAQIGHEITVTVTNIDAADHRFFGAFLGVTAEN